jgi:putative acetyltransferase
MGEISSERMITLERITALTPEATALLAELDRDLGSSYTAEQQHGLRPEALFQPNISFFVARLDGAAVGCGGVGLYDGFAEVKRMFTDTTVRGRGVAKAILARLEGVAREAGRPLLRLETGVFQHDAIAFYERMGFRECGAFGDYLGMTPRMIETSRFYEKPL